MSKEQVTGFIGTALLVASFLPPFAAVSTLFRVGGYILLEYSESRRRMSAEEDQGIKETVAHPDAALPVVYGEARVGGRIVDIRTDPTETTFDPDTLNEIPNAMLTIVVAWCVASEDGSGIENIDVVYFDDQIAAQNGSKPSAPDPATEDFHEFLDYAEYLGTDAQTVDPDLNTRYPTVWDSDSRLRGIAYSRFSMFYNREAWQSGIPNSFSAEIKGNKVYDPRTGTTGYSNNPALCLLDYLTSKRYGGGVPLSEIDTSSIIDNANLQEEVTGTYTRDDVTGTIDIVRGRCGAGLDTGLSLEDNIGRLAITGRINLTYQNGSFRMHTHTLDTPVSFELTEDNIVGDMQYDRRGVNDVPTSVTLTYSDRYDDWEMNEVVFPDIGQTNSFVDAAGGFDNPIHVEARMCDDRGTAFDIAQVLFAESNLDQTIQLRALEEALQLQVGDIVPVTHSTPGWSSKLFRVISIGMAADGHVALSLIEYDDTAYDLDPSTTVPSNPGTDLPDPFSIAAPTNLVLTSDDTTALATQDGQFVPRILVEWDQVEDAFLDGYNIQYKKIGDTSWQNWPNQDRSDVDTFILPVTNGDEYDVRIRAFNTIGKKSDWVSGTVIVSTQPGGGVGTVPEYFVELEYFTDSGTKKARVILEVTGETLRATDPVTSFSSDAPALQLPPRASYTPKAIESGGTYDGKYTWEVALSDKHLAVVAFAIYYEVDSEERFLQRVLWIDVGTEANILDINTSYEGKTARTSIKGDADTVEIRADEGFPSLIETAVGLGSEQQTDIAITEETFIRANDAGRLLAQVSPQNSAQFEILKNGANVGNAIFGTSSLVAGINLNKDLNLVSGDTITIVAPSVVDANLSGVTTEIKEITFGAVSSPTPSFTGNTVPPEEGNQRRARFAVQTLDGRKRFFRAWGVNQFSEEGPKEFFEVNRYDEPVLSGNYVQVVGYRWIVSPAGVGEGRIELEVGADTSRVRIFSGITLAGQGSGNQIQYFYDANLSPGETKEYILFTDNDLNNEPGDIMQLEFGDTLELYTLFPEDADGNIGPVVDKRIQEWWEAGSGTRISDPDGGGGGGDLTVQVGEMVLGSGLSLSSSGEVSAVSSLPASTDDSLFVGSSDTIGDWEVFGSPAPVTEDHYLAFTELDGLTWKTIDLPSNVAELDQTNTFTADQTINANFLVTGNTELQGNLEVGTNLIFTNFTNNSILMTKGAGPVEGITGISDGDVLVWSSSFGWQPDQPSAGSTLPTPPADGRLLRSSGNQDGQWAWTNSSFPSTTARGEILYAQFDNTMSRLVPPPSDAILANTGGATPTVYWESFDLNFDPANFLEIDGTNWMTGELRLRNGVRWENGSGNNRWRVELFGSESSTWLGSTLRVRTWDNNGLNLNTVVEIERDPNGTIHINRDTDIDGDLIADQIRKRNPA